MAKKIKSKIVQIDTMSLFATTPNEWSNDDVDFITESITRRFTGHNPIVSVNLLEQSSYYSLAFKIEYIAKDSSATRFANTQRIREQLIMECL